MALDPVSLHGASHLKRMRSGFLSWGEENNGLDIAPNAAERAGTQFSVKAARDELVSRNETMCSFDRMKMIEGAIWFEPRCSVNSIPMLRPEYSWF